MREKKTYGSYTFWILRAGDKLRVISDLYKAHGTYLGQMVTVKTDSKRSGNFYEVEFVGDPYMSRSWVPVTNVWEYIDEEVPFTEDEKKSAIQFPSEIDFEKYFTP